MNERLHPYQRRFYILALHLLVMIARKLPGVYTSKEERRIQDCVQLAREIWPGLE